jgi:hypothetical protein
MGSANAKKKKLNAIPIITKLLVNISFTSAIFSVSHLLYISEKTGKRRANIGPIIIKDIQTIER